LDERGLNGLVNNAGVAVSVVGRDAKTRLKIKALVRDRGMDALIARTLNWK
jgi:hypothetical protein